MSKVIKQFRREAYGFFIDLEDTPASVAVNSGTGEIMLDEGSGDDRFHGAAISSEAFQDMSLRHVSDGRFQVVLSFGNNKNHVLGMTEDKATASSWIDDVIEAIRSHQHKESRSFQQ